MRLADLLPAARDSLADPRAGYRRVQALELDRATLWLALACVTAISVTITHVALLVLFGDQFDRSVMGLRAQPLLVAAIDFALLVVLAQLVLWGGRAMGGRGVIEDAILAVTWLFAILTGLQVIQIAALLVHPTLSLMIGLMNVGAFFWLLTGFVAELHGFASRGKVFLGLVIGILALSMALGIVLTLIGVSLPEFPDV